MIKASAFFLGVKIGHFYECQGLQVDAHVDYDVGIFLYSGIGLSNTLHSDRRICPRFFMSDITEINEEWARLRAVIEWSGMTPNQFARHIGYRRAETVYRIKRGLNGISRNMADTIVAHYPALSKGWLLTGEGQMLAGDGQMLAGKKDVGAI